MKIVYNVMTKGTDTFVETIGVNLFEIGLQVVYFRIHTRMIDFVAMAVAFPTTSPKFLWSAARTVLQQEIPML